MDKIGNVGEIKTGSFYSREDWGQPDQPNIWSEGTPSDLSTTIDFVYEDESGLWGADDDTDIEYMYQHLMHTNQTSILSPEQIRRGWLKHIQKDEENYLWVSNQAAYDLMIDGMLPPATSHPDNNPHYEMIDAQLTTEIFGLFSPTRPDVALKIAHLPIRTVARADAEWISKFYVVMHALASVEQPDQSVQERLNWMAGEARKVLPDSSYSAAMYDFVRSMYTSGATWEHTRDSIYTRYQVEQMDGYDLTSQNLYCNACFAAGINFAASLVSLFYGKGDIQETIKIGTLCGWDSDNPTATWGGLLGFMIGRKGIEESFKMKFSERYNIHRTRQNFPHDGIDTFSKMAKTGVSIVDRIVVDQMGGKVDKVNDTWVIPR